MRPDFRNDGESEMNTDAQAIQTYLFNLADVGYRHFQSGLLPTLPPDRLIGVRIPLIRAYARHLAGTAQATVFLNTLPHEYYDENNLHAALLEHVKDFDAALMAVEQFLPYIDVRFPF